MKVAVYYRVSTDMQDFAMQEHAVKKWLEEHEPKKVTEFKDFAYSGASDDRPAFRRMMRLAQEGKFELILCYRLDRLSRSARDSLELLFKLDRLRIDLVLITQPLLSTKDNPFRLTIYAAMAEIAQVERESLIRRIKDGIAASKARGNRWGPPIKLNPEVEEEIRRLHSQGVSFRKIADCMKVSVGSVHRAIHRHDDSSAA